MIVIRNDDFTANQDIIPDDHRVCAGDMGPMADTNVIADDQFRSKALVAVTCDRFQPQPVSREEVFSHRNTGESAKIGSATYVESADAEFAGQHTISGYVERPESQCGQQNIAAILLPESPRIPQHSFALSQ